MQTYDTEYGRVGLGICFDIHTILEKYEPHHIWCLLYPIAWVDAEHPAEWMFHQLPGARQAVQAPPDRRELERGQEAELARLRLQRDHLERGEGGGQREEPVRSRDRLCRPADREVMAEPSASGGRTRPIVNRRTSMHGAGP